MQSVTIQDALGVNKSIAVVDIGGGVLAEALLLGELQWVPVATTTGSQRKFTVSTTAVALNPPSNPGTGPMFASLTVETADVVYRDDGTAPTASDGNGFISAGYTAIVKIPTLANFKMIRKGATDATVWVGYYVYP
jgi:hypothetical protein